MPTSEDSPDANESDVAQPATFGTQLREFRRAAGLTQEELAERSGVSVRTISDLERNRRPAPHPGSAHLLAKALGLDDAQRRQFFAAIQHLRRLRTEARQAAGRTTAGSRSPWPGAGPILGRDAEIAAIEDHFAAGERLITLLGPGGVGKTRLAQAIAARRKDAGLRVLWVALDAISSPTLVLPAITRAAGATGPDSGGSPERTAAALGQTPILLVLDNVEHLITIAPDIAALLAAAPGLVILATSREALRIAGEHPVPIAPLPLPAHGAPRDALAANPAVALFRRALAAAAPMRSERADDPDDAAAIVTRLDGLPLAIELAAAQGAVLPLHSLATLLDTAGLALLARGQRDAHARFATMDAAIAWSADLLPPDARRLLRVLGAFRGGFTTDAIVAVCVEAGAPRLGAALPSLAEANLILLDPADPASRLRMLEPVRMFALDRLRSSGEEPAARAAHASHFLRWARAQGRLVGGADPLPALDALDADLANIQAALAAGDPMEALITSTSLIQYWELRARFREGRDALAAALANLPLETARASTPSTAVMDALFWSGYLAYLQSDVPAIAETIQRLHPLAETDGTPEYRVRVLLLEVLKRDAAGEPAADSIPLGRAAQALMADQPRETSWRLSTEILGNLLAQAGDAEGALPLLRDAAGWARSRNAAAVLNSVSDWLGFTLLETGGIAEARARFSESIAWSARNGLVGTVNLPLLGYILATTTPDAPRPDLERAATLIGALETDLARSGYPLGARNAAALDAARARIAGALGGTTFAALVARGRDLPLADALALVTT